MHFVLLPNALQVNDPCDLADVELAVAAAGRRCRVRPAPLLSAVDDLEQALLWQCMSTNGTIRGRSDRGVFCKLFAAGAGGAGVGRRADRGSGRVGAGEVGQCERCRDGWPLSIDLSGVDAYGGSYPLPPH